ncbi:unnamed protein product, partial [Sphacelaria rigidula]
PRPSLSWHHSYQDLFSNIQPGLGHCKTLPFELKLERRTTPISSRPYREKSVLTKDVNTILDACLGAGLIRHSPPWALLFAVSGRP